MCHSHNQPNLNEIASPKTKTPTLAYRNKRKQKQSQSSPSKPTNTTESNKNIRLSNLEVSEFLVQNNIQSTTELFAISKIRKDEGQRDLQSFVLSKSSKSLTELIDNTWKM